MAILTTEKCKAYLNITATTFDIWIAALIPAVEDEVKTLCNNLFLDSEGDEDFPASISYAAALMIDYQMNQVNGIESHSIESISTKFKSKYPDNIMSMLNKYTNKTVDFV